MLAKPSRPSSGEMRPIARPARRFRYRDILSEVGTGTIAIAVRRPGPSFDLVWRRNRSQFRPKKKRAVTTIPLASDRPSQLLSPLVCRVHASAPVAELQRTGLGSASNSIAVRMAMRLRGIVVRRKRSIFEAVSTDARQDANARRPPKIRLFSPTASTWLLAMLTLSHVTTDS